MTDAEVATAVDAAMDSLSRFPRQGERGYEATVTYLWQALKGQASREAVEYYYGEYTLPF